MENLKALLQIIEGKLHSAITLIAVLVFEIIFFVTINEFVSTFITNTSLRGIIYLVLLASWVVFWAFNRFHLPKNHKKKKKVGIVIAIFSENEIERQKLKADFISKLKEMLSQEKILDFSEIFFLKNHFAEEIVEAGSPVEKIKEFNKKIGAHFYVWGRIKKRPNNEEGERYFLTFQGYVVHKPIPQELSAEIAKDFSAVLPREINFPEREFRGFEASAIIIHLAIKYVVGLAAYISQDPRLAFRLHNGLREAFNAYRPLPPHLQEIRNKIPILLSEEAGWIARWHLVKNNNEQESKNFLEKSLSENGKNYGSWLFKAIMDFRAGKISESFKSIGSAEKFANGDCAWMYSKAFLHFWQGEYEKALKLCQKIRKQSQVGEENVCKDVREFNLQILESDDSKPQLLFWIGYISYFKDENLPQALKDFEKFEELENGSMPILKNKSAAYLTEIKHKMKLKS